MNFGKRLVLTSKNKKRKQKEVDWNINMDDTGSAIAMLLFVLFLFFATIVIIVALIRWLFRIDEIVKLLKNIHSAIQQQVTTACTTEPEKCAGCEKLFEKNQLKEIDSGQRLCLECIRSLKNKRG